MPAGVPSLPITIRHTCTDSVPTSVDMVTHVGIFALVVFSILVVTAAQRPPYLGSSDLGVLPQYLPEGTQDRFATDSKEPPKIQAGTLETEDVYNRVTQWPNDRKPFWYLNAAAIQNQREQEQAQAAQPQTNKPMESPSSSF